MTPRTHQVYQRQTLLVDFIATVFPLVEHCFDSGRASATPGSWAGERPPYITREKLYLWWKSWFTSELVSDRRGTVEEFTPLCQGFGFYASSSEGRRRIEDLSWDFEMAAAEDDTMLAGTNGGVPPRDPPPGEKCRWLASLHIANASDFLMTKTVLQKNLSVLSPLAAMTRLGGNTLHTILAKEPVISRIYDCVEGVDPFEVFESGIGDTLFSAFCGSSSPASGPHFGSGSWVNGRASVSFLDYQMPFLDYPVGPEADRAALAVREELEVCGKSEEEIQVWEEARVRATLAEWRRRYVRPRHFYRTPFYRGKCLTTCMLVKFANNVVSPLPLKMAQTFPVVK